MNMKSDKIRDSFYKQVGEEIVRKQYSNACMAKAMHQARGDEKLAKSLYIKYRINELFDQYQSELKNKQKEAERIRASERKEAQKDKEYSRQETERRITERRTKYKQQLLLDLKQGVSKLRNSVYVCPNCGHEGRMIIIGCSTRCKGIVSGLLFGIIILLLSQYGCMILLLILPAGFLFIVLPIYYLKCVICPKCKNITALNRE
jgi:rubrerythrin